MQQLKKRSLRQDVDLLTAGGTGNYIRPMVEVIRIEGLPRVPPSYSEEIDYLSFLNKKKRFFPGLPEIICYCGVRLAVRTCYFLDGIPGGGFDNGPDRIFAGISIPVGSRLFDRTRRII
jgi:hypothetical protein